MRLRAIFALATGLWLTGASPGQARTPHFDELVGQYEGEGELESTFYQNWRHDWSEKTSTVHATLWLRKRGPHHYIGFMELRSGHFGQNMTIDLNFSQFTRNRSMGLSVETKLPMLLHLGDDTNTKWETRVEVHTPKHELFGHDLDWWSLDGRFDPVIERFLHYFRLKVHGNTLEFQMRMEKREIKPGVIPSKQRLILEMKKT